MDFNDTPEEARFREEAVTWLRHNVPTDEAFWALTPLEQAKLWQKRNMTMAGPVWDGRLNLEAAVRPPLRR
jgi:hypothetical protein